MWQIAKNDDGKWEVRSGSGDDAVLVATCENRDQVLAVLAEKALAEQGETPEGVLPQRWKAGSSGIVLAEQTGDGRNFEGCVFSSRPLPLPVMLQTETAFGHDGAVLAGFVDTAGDPTAAGEWGGWFYASPAGEQASQILTAQGTFGVSVDPGAVEAEFVCTEMGEDDFGEFCEQGEFVFHSYEIAGFTMTPFPAFAKASITLDGKAPEPVAGFTMTPFVEPAGEPVGVSASGGPARPPLAWFEMPEPDVLDLVPQRGGGYGLPLSIDNDGRVFGHVAVWGTCHIGYPGECVTPPLSTDGYPHFHLGSTVTAEGRTVATGILVAGCDHAPARMLAREAQDHYANARLAWADVRVSNGEHGIWCSGALRPGIDEATLRVLRASALSGDWRGIGGQLEMIGCQTVNTPGFPITREALAASAFEVVPEPVLAYRADAGTPQSLVAAGVVVRPDVDALVAAGTVAPCETCGRRRARGMAQGGIVAQAMPRGLVERLERMETMLGQLLGRTEHLNVAEREHLRRNIRPEG